MNPRQFLLIGGVVLLVVGILGFVKVIGPTPADSVFGKTWFFDNGENWAHTILGAVAILAGFALPAGAQRGLVVIVGLVGIFFGVYNLIGVGTDPSGAKGVDVFGTDSFLENPLDTILHFAVGLWALLSAAGGRSRAMA